ncbi:hypothetical protein D6856_08290 [Butyrivibrio sp. XB500-5]|uniref:hypothetical protein n=1 Tax=Butyrivibrio sp. XB500-5 TaxID=2364880 RepID=UPI000EA8B309|nr:hypothetical protein [Butyrivibrio sp. XB500-5]RKM60073.1 hypothetical protein D6856_08290 [Butyrivibrio sp. XB500-5]
MSIYEEIRDQQKKLKDKDFKTKWNYFWDYYKIHVIVGLIALIAIILTVRSFILTKPNAIYAVMLNSGYEVSSQDLENGYMEYADVDRSEYSCLIDASSSFDQTHIDQMTLATSQKIMANVAAQEMDALGADVPTFAYYAAQDVFKDLRTVFSEDELKAFGDDIFYIDGAYMDYIASDEYQKDIMDGNYNKDNKYAVIAHEAMTEGKFDIIPKEEMERPIPIGIIMKDSNVLKNAGAYENSVPVVGIIGNTTRLDNTITFINYLYE